MTLFDLVTLKNGTKRQNMERILFLACAFTEAHKQFTRYEEEI